MNTITIAAIAYSIIALAVSTGYFFLYRGILKMDPIARSFVDRRGLGLEIIISGLLWPLVLLRLAVYFLGVAIAGPED